jgi:hypothetical protein
VTDIKAADLPEESVVATCTCDTINEPGFPHRPWCGLNHKHPGPDCVGLCEPAEVT